MSPLRRELRALVRLAAPVAAGQLSTMLLWTVDLLMVGRVSVEAFNAVTLGRVWVMGTLIVGMGVLFGIDPIASQAQGARDARRLGRVLVHGGLLALLVMLPVGASWLATERILVWSGQDPAVAALAHRYVVVQLPGLPFFLLFIVLKQFLQARGIARPAMWASFLGNGVNVLLNWLLIFGHAGFPRLETAGAGIATAVTQFFLFAALAVLVIRFRLQRGTRVLWHRSALRARELAAIASFGFPVALQLALEYWAFSLATLWSGRLGAVSLAANSIALNLASLSYMIPLGISAGAAARVGQRIGAGDPAGARRAAWVAIGLGAGVMGGFGILFIAARGALARLYTAEAMVVGAGAALLPIVAAFQLFDGTQVVAGAVLRGMGRPRPAAFANLIGYYVLALPLAWWLAFVLELGVKGIWWGLALGLAVVALLQIAWLWRRGPETVAPVL